MRKLVWPGPSIVILALCLSGSVATADDATSLLDKIDAAKSTVKSYQVDVTGPGDNRSSIVFVRGVGTRYHLTSGHTDFAAYLVGTTIYQRFNGGAWLKFVVDVPASTSLKRQQTAELLPDQLEDGVTVGAIKTEVTAMISGLHVDVNSSTYASGPIVCTYDKLTLLFRVCKTDAVTRQYSHYDDPSLTIDVPEEARNAPETHLPART